MCHTRRITSRYRRTPKLPSSISCCALHVLECALVLPSKCLRSHLANDLCAIQRAHRLHTCALVLRRVLAFANAETSNVHTNIKPTCEHSQLLHRSAIRCVFGHESRSGARSGRTLPASSDAPCVNVKALSLTILFAVHTTVTGTA